MPIDSGAPADPNEPVGAVLARMRRSQRITGAQLAAKVRMSQPKISRIERGQGVPDPEDIRTIARALGADDNHAQELVERAEVLHDLMADWRLPSIGIAGRQRTINEWERAATTTRSFEVAMVPGLLQTSGYGKSLFRIFHQAGLLSASESAEPAVLAAISARMRRQEVLADPSKSFQFILGEAVLRHRVLPPVEMLAQIAHLRDVVAQFPNVSVTVMPDDATVDLPLVHGFEVIDSTVVVTELYNTALTARSPRVVAKYHQVMDTLQRSAAAIEPFLDKYQAMYIDLLQKPHRADSL